MLVFFQKSQVSKSLNKKKSLASFQSAFTGSCWHHCSNLPSTHCLSAMPWRGVGESAPSCQVIVSHFIDKVFHLVSSTSVLLITCKHNPRRYLWKKSFEPLPWGVLRTKFSLLADCTLSGLRGILCFAEGGHPLHDWVPLLLVPALSAWGADSAMAPEDLTVD